MYRARGVDALATAQIAAVLLVLVAVLTDPSVWRIPDAMYEVAFPAAFAILFGIGLIATIRSRSRRITRIVLTLMCGALFVLMTALAQVPKSLPGF